MTRHAKRGGADNREHNDGQHPQPRSPDVEAVPAPTAAGAPADATADGAGETLPPIVREYQQLILELEDKLKRYAAELENTKKRHARERARLRAADQRLALLDWLKLVDSIENALAAAPEEDSPWREGLLAMRQQAQTILKNQHVEPIAALNQSFDERRHEATALVQDPQAADGTIRHVVETGYLHNDELLRPAKVIVVKNA